MQRFQRGSFQRRTEKLTGTARYGRIGMVFHVNLNGVPAGTPSFFAVGKLP